MSKGSRNANAPLLITTRDGGWEAVHPDVIRISPPFAGYAYWMAFTPYPLGNDRVENPTLRASEDGIHWESIPEMPEPVVRSPSDPEMHHADPELIYREGLLHLVYLTIHRRTHETTFSVMSCKEDLQWSEARVFYRARDAVSPTFQLEGGVLHEWFIRDCKLLRCDGPDFFAMGPERECSLSVPKYVPWHVDVLKVNDGYEALVAAFPRGTNNSRTSLFHFHSEDGLVFTSSRNRPIIRPSLLGWDNRLVYRSSFLKEEDGSYRVWYSACSWGRHWGIGIMQGLLDSLAEPAVDHASVPRYPARLIGDFRGWIVYRAKLLLSRSEVRL